LSTHYIKDLADWTETPAVPVEEKNRSVIYLCSSRNLEPSPPLEAPLQVKLAGFKTLLLDKTRPPRLKELDVHSKFGLYQN